MHAMKSLSIYVRIYLPIYIRTYFDFIRGCKKGVQIFQQETVDSRAIISPIPSLKFIYNLKYYIYRFSDKKPYPLTTYAPL